MMVSILIIFLCVIALLTILRSSLMEPCADILELWLSKRDFDFLAKGFFCDVCVGFWFTVLIAAVLGKLELFVPAYGLLAIYLRWRESRECE